MAKFEDNLRALESVVERLEHGDLALEESVKLFEEGVKLSSACKQELDAAEGKIQVLIDQGRGQQPLMADLEVEDGEELDEDDE